MKVKLSKNSCIDWRPDKVDLAFYHEHGWFVTPEILPEEVLRRAEAGIKSYYEGFRDHNLPDWATRFDWKPEHGNILRLNNYLSLQMDSVRDLISYPLIGCTAAFLTQSPAIRLYKDSAIVKPSSSGNVGTKVGWHTDRSYWMMCTSDNMLTAWIPFQDSDASNGAIAVIEKSHNWPITHNLRTFNNQDMITIEERFALESEVSKRVLNVRRGQVSFHNCRLLHGSMENKSKKERTVLAVHLQPDENRYRLFSDDNGKLLSHLNDYLCKKCPDGTPDYCDQEIFPELWRTVPIKNLTA